MIKYDRTMDCVEKKMDAVLTHAIPYSWRLSELFKEKVSYLSEATFEE